MGSYLEWFRSCSRITVTAHPAVAVPAGFTPDGLPIGLQLVGRHRGELGAAAARARDHRGDGAADRRPALMPWPHHASDRGAPRRLSRTPSRSRSGSTAPRERGAGAGRRHRRRPVHRRRRLHRAVGGAAREGARPGARRRRARGRDRRLRRERPQRRVRVASLTHGIENGLARFADEMEVLERLALENFDGLRADLGALRRSTATSSPPASCSRSTDAYQEPWLEEEAETLRALRPRGRRCSTRAAMRAEVASPTYVGGVWDHTGAGDPRPRQARRRAARRRAAAGVRVYEHSAVHTSRDDLHVPRRAAGPRRAPAASCSPRAPIRRCCARSGATSCRSTTTCW